MSLGCFGYREDTSGRTPARHGRLRKGDFAKQRETDSTTRGAQRTMEATEDWVGGPQLRHFLYGSRGRTRVSVY